MHDFFNFVASVFFGPSLKKGDKVIWSNKDTDIPVVFLEEAGAMGGVSYALVLFENRQSFVPMHELV